MKIKDLTGTRFGALVVIEREGVHITPKRRHLTWLCQCDCGNRVVVEGRRLKDGHTKSCGCKQYERGFNEYREEGDTVYIKVKDKEILIDKEDLMKIYPSKVNISSFGYATTKRNKKLHRLIMNCPKGYEVDHINHDKLDNRKSNLRIVTRSENQMNKVITSNTGEYGIHLEKGGYRVVIDGVHKGFRNTLSEAVLLRNESLIGTKQLELNYYLRGISG